MVIVQFEGIALGIGAPARVCKEEAVATAVVRRRLVKNMLRLENSVVVVGAIGRKALDIVPSMCFKR